MLKEWKEEGDLITVFKGIKGLGQVDRDYLLVTDGKKNKVAQLETKKDSVP